jgi:CBS domain-containing protein
MKIRGGFVFTSWKATQFLYFQTMHTGSTFLSEQFYTKNVRDLHFRHLRIMRQDDPVHECAALMKREQVSCLFIGDSKEEITGYVTDITLRDRLIAERLPSEIPVSQIMESAMVSIHPDVSLAEALILMFQTKSRYLLVRENGEYIGWISRTKILTEQSQGPFMFIQSVKEARQIPELRQKWNQMPEIIHLLSRKGMKAGLINQIITTVADTVTQRVIERVIKEIGPAPSKFVFFVFGSEGRGELTLKTDQDNAIIYEDKANEHRDAVRAYFLNFATRISTALDKIGIVFCEGELMAMNPKWTHSLSHWKRNYDAWISDASQETAMNYSTFFDCRAIYGEFSLLEDLKNYIGNLVEKAPERFFINLGHNALQFQPPLTFFRKIKTEEIDGEQQLNLKQTMRPIVDLARVYALKYRIFETSTTTRIELLKKKGVFSEKEAQELTHAFDYMMSLRLENQTLSILDQNRKPKNFLKIKALTKVQQVTLIEIFKVIEEFQSRIKLSFTRTL